MGSAGVNSVHTVTVVPFLFLLKPGAHARSCLCRDVVCLSVPRLLHEALARDRVLCDNDYSTDCLAASTTS